MRNNSKIRFEYNTITAENLIGIYVEIGWGTREDYNHLDTIIHNESCQYFSLYVDENLVGFSKVLTDCFSFSLLVEIVIKPLFQGKGYGKILLDYTEQQIPTKYVFIHSLPKNKDFFLQRNYKETAHYHLFLKKIS